MGIAAIDLIATGNTGTDAGTGAAAAPRTSPLVTRPSLPVPGTEPAARLLSAISFAAAGIGTPAMEPLDAGAVAVAATGAAVAAADETATAPTVASVSILAINCSAATVAPSATTSSTSTPADGAGTSRTTLSVSISIRISSTAMASPTFFFHCSMVASATDSDSWGTLTSTIAIWILSKLVFMWGKYAELARGYLVSTKPLSLPNAPSTNAFCCSWCRCE